MSLGHAVLAALLSGEASGYDLAKSFQASVANFWVATPQQLYREVDRLEAAALIAGRVVEQHGRPNKRVFTLTAAGRAHLIDFLGADSRPTSIKDDLLVKVQALDLAPEPVEHALRAHLAQAQAKLAQYEALRDWLLHDQDEADYLLTAPEIGPYLTLLRGWSFEQENIAWASRCLAVLQARRDPKPA